MEAARWRCGTEVAFRFTFLYFLLYTLFVPEQFLSFVPFKQLFERYNQIWQKIVPWVGTHILRMGHDFSVFVINPSGGSQDTAFVYVLSFCYLILAIAGTLLWSVLDRDRSNYDKLNRWLMLYLRMVLAITMINFATVKIFPTQFPDLALSRLLERYGNSSPMGLLWNFMGASRSYSFFAGAVELVGALLLLLPRLATAGALVTMAAMTNVLILNLGYDVPVKLGSIHYLVMAGFIVAPDVRRLLDFFFLNKNVPAPVLRPLFQRKSLQITAVALQIAFGLSFLGFRLHRSEETAQQRVKLIQSTPLYGIWTVDEFALAGDTATRSPADQHRWQTVVVDSKDEGTVEVINGAAMQLLLHFNPVNRRLSMTMRDHPEWIAEFAYERPQPNSLILSGSVNGHPVQMTLHKVDDAKFLLRSRKFHWIQESALNR